MFCPAVCNEPMLEGETIAQIDGAGTPDTDGLVELPLDEGTVIVPFSTPARQLTQLKFKPPTGTRPGDEVTVVVKYTTEEGEVVQVCISSNVTSASSLKLSQYL